LALQPDGGTGGRFGSGFLADDGDVVVALRRLESHFDSFSGHENIVALSFAGELVARLSLKLTSFRSAVAAHSLRR
jgi:hypothetical protein